MTNSIFLLDANGRLSEMNEESYITEDVLQKLLADYPRLIPGSQINSNNPCRWLFISREYGVPDKENGSNRWSLDNLFIDQEAVPTLVEVKRSSDTRIRREVIGQILDYAANAILYWSIEEIINQFVQNCEERGENHEEVLRDFLDSASDPSQFWTEVETNLRAGKLRLILIADEIPTEMLRIIEFLNGQMKPAEILGVEIRQFTNENLKTLVPTVVGMTVNAQSLKSVNRLEFQKWDEASFFEELSQRTSPADVSAAHKLFEWAKPRVTRIWFGEGNTQGSFVPILNAKTDHQLFAVLTTGWIELYFQYYMKKPPFESETKRLELCEKLNSIPGIDIPVDKISKRPKFSLAVLSNDEAFAKFTKIYNWFLEEVKASNI
ncbi:MAG TPA: hypothetical protein VEW28_08285 [Candidatus Kapabacteria bacterium]|nr:hypothetical protein [Candidatus Kapabacteria bacterium]